MVSRLLRLFVGPSKVHPETAPPSNNGPSSSKSSESRDVQPASGPVDPHVPEQYNPGKLDIYLLGISIAVGGQYFGWNSGISAGIYTVLLAYMIIASGYVTLCSCLGEINGALPFAGGAYGLARCTLGFYPAFMIGCCDALEYTAYVSAGVISFTNLIAEAAPAIEHYRPLLWAIFYATAMAVNIKGARVFWTVNLVLGVVSLLLLLLFCLGSLPYVDFNTNASGPGSRGVGGFSELMQVLPLTAWFFIGVEALSLASDSIAQPKTLIPAAQISCISTLVVTGLAVFFVAISLPPGAASLPGEEFPFSRGFALLFNTSRRYAALLSLPATFATAFGFMWCYGKLICAMATSRLLLPIFARTTPGIETPYAALLLGSACSYGFCLITYIFPSLTDALFRVCILSASVSYTGQCVGYISLKRNYRNIKSSSFASPWGVGGAVYSMLVWILTAVALIAFQDDGGIAIAAFLLMVAALSTYYFGYARKRQTFSAQENKIMLVAHVMKFNNNKVAARRHKSGQRTRGGTESSQSEKSRKMLVVPFTKHVPHRP
jgi:ethanolamine permease